MNTLPFTARTATGDTFEIEFPLHEDTESAMRVSQLVSVLLESLDREIAVLGSTSNGDVLQAMAMAMAVRSRMIHAPNEITAGISRDVLESALGAVARADRNSPPAGHA